MNDVNDVKTNGTVISQELGTKVHEDYIRKIQIKDGGKNAQKICINTRFVTFRHLKSFYE